MPTEWNADYANYQRGLASDQATAAYNQAMANNQGDQNALGWAKFAWQKVMDTAGLTGKFEDAWTMPSNKYFTDTFGTWMPEGPQAGQESMAKVQQGYGQSNALGGMYGGYYAPGTAPAQGTATLGAGSAAASQAATRAGLTGYLQNTGTGNIVNDAWNLLDTATQEDYVRQHGTPQAAQAAYFANLQNAVQARAKEAGVTVTPQTMNDYVYGAWDSKGNETQQHQQQMFTQNLQTEQEARAAQAQQQGQTQSYLSLLSSLRGPADWAKYQQVLGSTPGGMRDLAAAAMGQYVPGGGATTGYQPQAASLQSMQAQIAGQDYYGQGGGQLNQPNVYGGGQGSYGQQTYAQAQQPGQEQMAAGQYRQPGMQQAQGGQLNTQAQYMQQQPGQQPGQEQMAAGQYRQAGMQQAQGGQMAATQAQYMDQRYRQPTGQPGQMQVPQQNNVAWGSGIGIGPKQQQTYAQLQQAQGNGTNMYGAQQNQMGQLPAPNQIASQSWSNMAPSQQQMLLGQYESQGWDKGDVQALMNQALPKYGSNAPRAGTWRMQ